MTRNSIEFILSVGRATLILATTLSVGAGAALADPPEWAGRWRAPGHHHHHHHDDDDDDYRVVYVPQYGTRTTIVQQQVTQVAPVARGLPYGFNRGTCDRGLVSGEVVGDVVGGLAGGLLGSRVGRGSGRTAATIGGTLVGVLVGGSVGRSMDTIDQGCVAGGLNYLPDNRAIAWQGDGGADYRMVPVRSWNQGGSYCREYQTVAMIGGHRQVAYGTACRQPDGQWQIVN
ncbi:MAG: glycine zipper 2TM domain-containing protein [Actinomycetota bacterium]